MRAALWLVESGTCPDFKVKYTVSRLSDAEAALVNLSENLQREDPRPIQLAHAIRALTEDYGLTLKQVAGRLKMSETWLKNLLNLVMLPSGIQASVASGQTPVAAALELVKQLKKFLEGKTGPEDDGKNFANYLLAWLDGERTGENLDKYWDRTFAEPAGPRMTG